LHRGSARGGEGRYHGGVSDRGVGERRGGEGERCAARRQGFKVTREAGEGRGEGVLGSLAAAGFDREGSASNTYCSALACQPFLSYYVSRDECHFSEIIGSV